MELAENVYELVAYLPADERFGLVSQLRRAAVSIPSRKAGGMGGRANMFTTCVSRGALDVSSTPN